MPRMASGLTLGVPLMTLMERSAVIGSRPSSRPYRMAAATTAGLPRIASGTKSVPATLAARSPIEGSTSAQESTFLRTRSDMSHLQFLALVGR